MKTIYRSIEALISSAEKEGKKLGEFLLSSQAEEMELSEEELFQRMKENLHVMKNSAEKGKNPSLRSFSGISGGDSAKVEACAEEGLNLCGPLFTKCLSTALAVSEYNACMGKIVAAPTAGSCGILPGVLLPLLEEGIIDEQQAVLSLFTAGGFGMIIANRASISGAEGGCQAECGSAAGMAAAALVELYGGTPRQSAEACAIALKNEMGLVCDPVAGLVEIPCIKRNAGGVSLALMAAQLALADVSSVIPCDEVISAMKSVGDAMPCSLKESALGGLATTDTGLRIKTKLLIQKE